MARRTVPRTDGGLLSWARNMAEKLVASPDQYGVSAEAASQYQTLYDAYFDANMQCVRGVRTISATTVKNQAASALRARSAQLVMLILSQPGLSDAQKQEIGVRPRVAGSLTPPPEHSPGLAVLAVSNLTATVWLFDKNSSANRGRPPRTQGAMVYSYVGSEPPNTAEAWKHEGAFGRRKFDIAFASNLPPGVQVWLCACWFNGRKQSGPMSPPKTCHLPGGGVTLIGGLRSRAA